MADISLWVGQVGDVIQFTVLSAPPAADLSFTILDLSGAVVTWLGEDGINRGLSVVSVGSGVVQYTTSAGDFPAPTVQRGQLRISLGTGRFYSSYFSIAIHPNFGP